MSVVQFHDHSFVRKCKYFQMFLSSFAPQEGNQVKTWSANEEQEEESHCTGQIAAIQMDLQSSLLLLL